MYATTGARFFLAYSSSIKTGEKMNIKLHVLKSMGYVNNAKALFNRNGESPGGEKECILHYSKTESTEEYCIFEGEVIFDSPGYRTFYIQLTINNKNVVLKYDPVSKQIVPEDEIKFDLRNRLVFWELFVYYSTFRTPQYVKGGIMYQIFVDTFCSKDLPENLKEKVVDWGTYPKWEPDSDGVYRNNQFYGGNLKGIIEKLPYIKSLGVTMIYLTPIFMSPSSNRYDTSDYEQIDELVGTWEELDILHKKANELGIKLVLDLVFNHSSNENEMLKADPEMYSWKEKYTVPNCWWGYSHLVEFNKDSENYFKNLEKWLKLYSKYVDGIRLDVADNLPDNVLKFIRKVFKEEDDSKYVLFEVWKNAITGDFREFLYGDEADGVMNYQFANAIYRYVRWKNYRYFERIVKSICKLYPKETLDVSPIFLTSHDIPRALSILVGDFMKEDPQYENVWDMEKDLYWYTNGMFDTYKFRKWEFDNDKLTDGKAILAYSLRGIAVFLQYTLPGLPSIFAGDEAGVVGFKDPFNRKPFPWDNIDQMSFGLYFDLGLFRTFYSDIFADSSNFEIIEADEKKFVYRRGDLTFFVNISEEPLEINYKEKEKIVFSLVNSEDDQEKNGFIEPYNAIVLK